MKTLQKKGLNCAAAIASVGIPFPPGRRKNCWLSRHYLNSEQRLRFIQANARTRLDSVKQNSKRKPMQQDSLPATLQAIWQELARAPLDKHHEWRIVQLATVQPSGGPTVRSVVLREVNRNEKTLTIFTDARSQKINEIERTPQGCLHFWSKRLGWQLCAQVTLTRVQAAARLEAAWARVSQSPTARDYLAAQTPGTAIADHASAALLPADQHHFAMIDAKVISMDWLSLAREGNQRAMFDFATGEMRWLQP
jgi:pyridoxamine 5'-phosphate oxidase